MKRAMLTLAFAAAAMPAAAHASDTYIGAFGGYASSKPDYVDVVGANWNLNPSIESAAAGAYIGHDLISTGVHVGIEADIGVHDKYVPDDAANPFNDYTAFNTKWNAHLRARVAAPIGASTKVFVAGGAAFLKLNVDDTDPGFGKYDHTYSGWTLGGGIEQSLAGKFTLRLEYLHDVYGRQSANIDDAGVPNYDITVKPSSNIVRAGVALKF